MKWGGILLQSGDDRRAFHGGRECGHFDLSRNWANEKNIRYGFFMSIN